MWDNVDTAILSDVVIVGRDCIAHLILRSFDATETMVIGVSTIGEATDGGVFDWSIEDVYNFVGDGDGFFDGDFESASDRMILGIISIISDESGAKSE